MHDLPDHLERVVLSAGPTCLQSEVEEVGGVAEAARIMGVTAPTVHRWLYRSPHRPAEQPARAYRSVWPGYPSPLPAFDRVVEQLDGPGASFLARVLSERGTWPEVHAEIVESGLSLSMLKEQDAALSVAIDRVGAPSTTAWRWMQSAPYPRQWHALDALCQHTRSCTWLELVVRDLSTTRRPIPLTALSSLVELLLDGGIDLRDIDAAMG